MNLESACARLVELLDALESNRTAARRALFRAALEVEHCVLSGLLAPEEEDAVLADPRIRARLAVSQAIFCDLESEIERSMARLVRLDGASAILGQDDASQHYLARYQQMAGCEVALAGLRNEERALFIGSGFLPITAFEYAWQAGCAVDCVDFVPEAVACSRDIAGRLDLAGRVRMFERRGEDHDPSPYDVILVGVLAEPKGAILHRLEQGVRPGCRVLLRTTLGLRELIYRRAAYDPGALTRLRPAGQSVATGDRVISAELLVAE